MRRSRGRARAERMNSPQRPHEVRLRGLPVTGGCHAAGSSPCTGRVLPLPLPHGAGAGGRGVGAPRARQTARNRARTAVLPSPRGTSGEGPGEGPLRCRHDPSPARRTPPLPPCRLWGKGPGDGGRSARDENQPPSRDHSRTHALPHSRTSSQSGARRGNRVHQLGDHAVGGRCPRPRRESSPARGGAARGRPRGGCRPASRESGR